MAFIASVLALTCADLRAHCDEPPGSPSRPARVQNRLEPIFPPRWSWLHWWEANRDLYLQPQKQGVEHQDAPTQLDDPRHDERRKRAAAELVNALSAGDARLRAAAVLALGQMGEEGARGQIAALLQGDPDQRVRHNASVALGLLNSEAAERALLDSAPAIDKTSRLVGLGLRDEQDKVAADGLSQTLTQNDPLARLAAAWALRQTSPPNAARSWTDVLRSTESPLLAVEAILGLGGGGEAAVPLLSDILLATDRGRSLPAWNRLETLRKQRIQAAMEAERASVAATQAYSQAYDDYLAAYDKWVRDSGQAWLAAKGKQLLPPPAAPGPDLPVVVQALTIGGEEIYEAHLRAAAAIALGRIDHPLARKALVDALAQRGDEWEHLQTQMLVLERLHEFSDLHKGMALMSLGMIGDEKTLPAILGILEGRIPTPAGYAPERMKDSPLRGYAALALGLYARPVETKQGPVDRRRWAEVCRILGQRAANVNETLEVRSAAALALGLTTRTENLRHLQALGDLPARADAVLRGYGLLGRALLGDRNILKAAETFLKEPEATDSMSSTLGRRATVLALGVLGVDEAIPLLVFAWDQSYYVNREVAVAMSLGRAYSTTDKLIDLMNNFPKALGKEFAARCLGEMFTKERPQRLARIIAGSNYAMRNDAWLAFRSMANEFLFRGLIPAFGGVWP